MTPYKKTKAELISSAISMTELKKIAFSLNKLESDNKKKIKGVNDFKLENKQSLVDLIWNAWGGDDGWERHKASLTTQGITHQKDTTDQSLIDDEVIYSSSVDKPRPISPEQKTKVKTNRVIYKLKFDFIDSNIMTDLNIKLKKYTHGTIEPPDADDISPKELINLLNTDTFCEKIAKSLKDIYEAKLKKYKKLQETTVQHITNDTNKKNKLILTKYVDNQELDSLFPMIAINTSFLIKLRTLSELALKKSTEYSDPLDKKVINLVRKNILLSITDEDNGILSLTGSSRVKIRNQLCKTLYILSKGFRPFMDSFLNLVFTGPTGVEKTKLAKTYGFVLENSGILLKGDLIVASQKNMGGEYVGHTAIKSTDVLMKGMEGLILIDESYKIMSCNEEKINKDSKSFSSEAITEIVNFLNKYMGMSIMIVEGYKREMNGCFFGGNQGLNKQDSIKPCSKNYLLTIFINRVNTKIGENIFNEEIIKYIFTMIVKLSQMDSNIFGNQEGDMINLSSMFLNSYYGSVKITWGTYENDILIVNSTFNQFLRNKGYLAVFSD